jgi:hypothetical protein
VSVDREQVRKVIDLFSTVYQDLGELAPTYENDHLVVKAYELARVAGNVSLLLRSAIGDAGFREVDDIAPKFVGLESDNSKEVFSTLISLLIQTLDEARSSSDGETAELLGRAAEAFQGELALLGAH